MLISDLISDVFASDLYRVIVPYLRGFGPTRFIAADAVRNGQQAVLARDVIALMDALTIGTATLGGCDWGARTACIVAAIGPRSEERRVGNECVSEGRYRGAPVQSKKRQKHTRT